VIDLGEVSTVLINVVVPIVEFDIALVLGTVFVYVIAVTDVLIVVPIIVLILGIVAVVVDDVNVAPAVVIVDFARFLV
jgi:hypothetical protein